MTRSYNKRLFCPKCGYSGMPDSGNLCPNCGKGIPGPGGMSLSRKGILLSAVSVLLLVGGLLYIHLFHPRIAIEVARAVHPLPKHFHVGIDVSASINQDALEKIKDVLLIRLRRFAGDESVSCQVSTFGNPGCGKQSISTLFTLSPPVNRTVFDRTVEKKVASIAAAPIDPRDITPLTTPFYCFLETALAPGADKRIIIFSDLMNDDSDCREQFIFPEEALERFGADKSCEIVFLYTSPRTSDDPELNQRLLTYQKEFIGRMNTMAEAGKVRVFFHHIPDDPLKSLGFIRKEMGTALPSTIGDGIRDRLSRIFHAACASLIG